MLHVLGAGSAPLFAGAVLRHFPPAAGLVSWEVMGEGPWFPMLTQAGFEQLFRKRGGGRQEGVPG